MNTITTDLRPVRIYTLTESSAGPELRRMAFPSRRMSLKTHYNEDLIRLHPLLLRSLRTKGRPGLYLFSGRTGTGKRSYIRSLLPQLNKACLFLSPQLAGTIESARLSGILLRNPESILVIEDAEAALAGGNRQCEAFIARINELLDGILGSSLGIQVICSFNMPLDRLDSALLGKDRVIARYEFGPLSAEKARRLLQAEGEAPVADAPATLAEIFKRRLPDLADLT